MRTALAEKLLVRIMNWSSEEVQKEIPFLQALSNFKYDQYQQFSPGIRFIESLVKWLKQFDTTEEKRTSYDFMKSQLIFISNEQISHLVNLTFSEKVKPIIIEKTAKELKVDKYCIKKITQSKEYKINLRRTIFIGLSDGSKIDQFRRSSRINNEQVSPTYQISQEKATDMTKELKNEIGEEKFQTIFLIDDFTASGKSYCRIEENKGKIIKFFNSIKSKSEDNHLSTLIDMDNLTINLIFYIATQEALDLIRSSVEKWRTKEQIRVNVNVDALQIINNDVKSRVLECESFISITEKYFDKSIIDRHYEKGQHTQPNLGFNECALPLILNHNTPNNSLPILWFPEDKEWVGLFPRVSRHK